MGQPARMFRGSELPRLLLLLAIVVVGWPLVILYANRAAAPARRPRPIAETPAPPPADTSDAFQGIQDKTEMTFRDYAGYAALLKRTREASPRDLAARSYRDLPYAELWERPERYRGVLLHIEGTARRVLVHQEVDQALAPQGKLYEAYVFNHETQNNPYILIFEDPPAGFPGGLDISERVRFDGYFLKLLAYRAGDVVRAAPMLVGRLTWIPHMDEAENATGSDTRFWLYAALTVMTAYALLRWLFHMRSRLFGGALGKRRTSTSKLNETIEPEELSNWIEQVGEEPEESYLRDDEDDD